MNAAYSVSTKVNAALSTCFDGIAAIDLPSAFLGYGPLPAVTAVIDQSGNWDQVGQTRTLRLSDGTTLRESLTDYQRPQGFAYTASHYSGALRHLVSHAEASWAFEPIADSQSTKLTWRYRFVPRSALTAPLVALISRLLWRGYMRKSLRLCAAIVEADASLSS